MSHSWIQLDLNALAWNYRLVQEKIGPHKEVLAVVKANAYGHGMIPIATALRAMGMQWFGVAGVAEGCRLREILPDAKILVMGCILDEEIPDLFQSDLIPAVSSLRFAQELNGKAQRNSIPLRVHLKVDTGMGRLGIHPHALQDFLNQVAQLPYLRVEGMMSHLASADEKDLEPSVTQLWLFESATEQAKAAGLHPRWMHVANSHAIFRLPKSHFNLVRCGLFLYGLYATQDFPEGFGLKPVLQWKARIGLIKEFHPGQTVSYGRTHTIHKTTKVAVISVGYADGYDRRLSNRGRVLIHGQYAPVVGRVTMDHIMVDVGSIPGAEQGDEVVLIGSQGDLQIRVEDMAQWLDTISYEVVCGIGPRVRTCLIAQSVGGPTVGLQPGS
jgi:alanine racemase